MFFFNSLVRQIALFIVFQKQKNKIIYLKYLIQHIKKIRKKIFLVEIDLVHVARAMCMSEKSKRNKKSTYFHNKCSYSLPIFSSCSSSVNSNNIFR